MSDVGGNGVEKSAGQHLRDAREAAGLTIEDVSTKLKLSPKQVLAIEAEDWDVLPERTFTRGFFRGYARLVGVDERLVDQAFARGTIIGEMRTLPAGIGEVTAENTTARASIAKWLIPVVLIACLAAGVAWFMRSDLPMPQANSKLTSPPATVSSSTTPTKPSAETTAQLLVAPAETARLSTDTNSVSINEKNSTLTQFNSASNVGAANTVSTSSNTAVVSSTSAPPAASSASATAASQPPLPTSSAPPATPAPSLALAAGQKKVSLTVNGRSWAEVRSKGDVVLSEMLSNTSRELAANGPIYFVIGNSSNVQLAIDGKPYDFSMHVRNEVARFRVE
jgi:cytoskeleton protein RodZ